MKLDKITLAVLALGGMVSLPSCDNIDDNDRFNEVPKPVVPIEEVTKTLLIQEFTGHLCTNCPQGAAALHNIQDAYPGDVIVVGLHARGGGPNNKPYNGQDFRTKAAQAQYEFYNPAGLPCAVFNGTETSTAFDQWMTLADSQMGQIANLSIKTQCEYDEVSRNLTVDYSLDFTHDVSNDDGYGVMVWVMENNIIGYQLDGGTMLENYEHNHVLRASLNGDEGQMIGKEFKKGSSYNGTASMILDESWKPENCQVVVYMFDMKTRAVEQSVLADVVSEKVVDDPHKVPQTLLIQEFTGHMCTNCPQGAAELHNITESYPSTIVVGLHARGAGPNTKPLKNGQDFRSAAAQVLYEHYNPAGLPCAVFNGTEITTSYDQWYTIATEQMSMETSMNITVSTQFDNDTREVVVNYNVDFTEDVQENLNVMVWVMENNIIGSQLDGGTMREDYVHNHVLRASLNGDWGENIGNAFSNGQRVKGSASMILESDWVAGNCQIVVYTFNNGTKAVRQAALANVNVTD